MSDTIDTSALFKLGYGLYAVTVRDGERDNALILNTVMQISERPLRIAVSVSKANYSYEMIRRTGEMNVCCITEEAEPELIKRFGFVSGRDTDKLADAELERTENGLALPRGAYNAFISLKVEQSLELDSHCVFICSVTEARVLGDEPSMTYAYYHENVKPRFSASPKDAAIPEEKTKKYVCKVCGYVYEGEELPEDFVCPWCKHGAEAFEPVG